MLKKVGCAIVATAAMAVGPVFAGEPHALRSYFNIGGQYIFADQDSRMSDDGAGVFASVGKPFNRYFGLELTAYGGSFDQDRAPDNNKWREVGGDVAAMFTFPLSRGWVPFARVGFGLTSSDLKGGGDSTDGTYSYGAGVFKYFKTGENRELGVRFDALYRLIDINDDMGGSGAVQGFNNDFDETVVRLSFVLPFGKPLAYKVKEAPVVAAAAPAPAPAEPAVKDSDGDGVIDEKDLCPDTPAGTVVDGKGCPLAQQLGGPAPSSLETVYFGYDRYDISAESQRKLDRAAKAIKEMKSKNAKLVVQVVGHTDDRGTDNYNVGLGERRAKAVKDYLVKAGIEADRIEVVSYGKSRPAADNATAEGRGKNRRVELETMGN